jgi:hypothetical protein
MEQITFWETDSRLANWEIPLRLCNVKFYCRVHKNPPLVPILSQMNPIRTLTTYFLRSTLILPFIYSYVPQKVSFLHVFWLKFCMHISTPHECWMPLRVNLHHLVTVQFFEL